MPCYSNIETVLMRIEFIEAAANLLDLTFEQINENRLVIKNPETVVILERAQTDGKFSVMVGASSYNYGSVINPLVMKYAEQVVEDFALTNGYIVTQGESPNQLQLISIS